LDGLFRRIEGDHKTPNRDAEFGYESYHRIYYIPAPLRSATSGVFLPKTFEMQVRTIFMHAYAEPQHDMNYKGADELPSEIRRELAWIAASAWGADQAYDRVLKWINESAERSSV
jgi:ppGpp synthetase/RelA/SpoT-type nucleotidyltranferase